MMSRLDASIGLPEELATATSRRGSRYDAHRHSRANVARRGAMSLREPCRRFAPDISPRRRSPQRKRSGQDGVGGICPRDVEGHPINRAIQLRRANSPPKIRPVVLNTHFIDVEMSGATRLHGSRSDIAPSPASGVSRQKADLKVRLYVRGRVVQGRDYDLTVCRAG